HNKVIRHIEREQKMIDDGEIKVVGKNYFRAPDLKLPEVWVHEYDENIAKQMWDKLARIRQNRDNEKASNCIKALVDACKNGKNVMEYTVECARADVTEGEMRKAFVEAFGLWKPPIYS
ncbi:methylmalonyl-CoA mutase family protein, partial [Chloroflexota bacterium]